MLLLVVVGIATSHLSVGFTSPDIFSILLKNQKKNVNATKMPN